MSALRDASLMGEIHSLRSYLRISPAVSPGRRFAARRLNALLRDHPLDVTARTWFGAKICADTKDMIQRYLYMFVLLAFYDFPAEHWTHLKTTNPIESTFATVRLRTKVTKGPGSRTAGLAMAYKLLEAVETRWRAVNGPHLVALVRAGATFTKGVLAERPTEATNPEPEKAAA